MWEGHSGTGTGEFTPDGSSIDLYRRLPVGGEPDVIKAAVPSGASILELGSGTGRVTHPLLAHGFTVTAVDESAEMLAHVRGAETVNATIQDLELPDRFDVVLLGSCLVHTADPAEQARLLRTCARHLKPGGTVLIQREGVDWHDNVPRERTVKDCTVRVTRSTEVRPGVREVHVEYVFPDTTWTQTFRSRPLTDAAFDAALAAAGLAVETYLTEDRTWVRAKAL